MRPDWLDNMPPSWNSVPFGSIFTQSKRKNSRLQRDFVLSVIKDRGVIPYTEKGNVGNKVSDDLSGYKLVDKGDFVLNSMNLYMGSVGVSDYDGVTSTAYIVCKPSENVYAGYYNYLIQFKGFQEYVGLLGKGIMEIREAVRWTALKSVFVPLPDLATQRAIADFLDRETARIDLLIEKKQRLVALLGEKLSSFVEKLLAFGPDDASEKVETGNVWLPRVASGVQLLPIKRVARLVNGYAFSSDDLGEEGVPVIRIGDVGPSIDLETAKKFTGVPSRSLDQFLLRKGDILIAMTGATIGKSGVYDSDARAYLNQRVGILRANRIDRRYLSNCLGTRIFIEQMKLFAYGGAQPNIGAGEIGSILIPVPALEVQKVIAGLVEAQSQTAFSTSSAVQASIDRLKEYRSALITAAVTGQIDVSTYAKSATPDRRLDAIQEEMDKWQS